MNFLTPLSSVIVHLGASCHQGSRQMRHLQDKEDSSFTCSVSGVPFFQSLELPGGSGGPRPTWRPGCLLTPQSRLPLWYLLSKCQPRPQSLWLGFIASPLSGPPLQTLEGHMHTHTCPFSLSQHRYLPLCPAFFPPQLLLEGGCSLSLK